MITAMLTGCGPDQTDVAEKGVRDDLGSTSQGISYGGHDYLFIKTPKNWYEAQSLCSSNGYKLVTIDDAAEEAFLNTHQSLSGLNSWWIGLNDIGTEGFFIWDGGFSSYLNWYPGEPNNSGNEDCIVDRYNGNDTWNDAPCGNQYPFVCERDVEPTSNRGSFDFSATNTSSGTVGTANRGVYLYAGQIFTVATCGVPGASGVGDTYLRVNNPSGQEVAANDDAGGACSTLSNITFLVTTSGTHTIRAGCYSSGTCSGTVAYNY
ncbi:C-type lectin domain-containing protein [Corallococcus coralloides]|uniref:C-type lectin domain-containing protein n=1 Tax=Corallococcus coralloides TaxID=184914 RepID=UPI0038507A4C